MTRLDAETFLSIVRHTPLVSVDLIVRDAEHRTLVGLRNNEPAKDSWFVPGGRICKDERIDAALVRVARDELGVALDPAHARLLGVYEHLYETNFAQVPAITTHYVVLAHELRLNPADLALDPAQHRAYRWLSQSELRTDPTVHPNTRAYT